MDTKQISLMVVLAALYIAVGLVIPSISFGAIQCRISDALYPLIAFMGMPAVIALTMAQLIYNAYGFSMGFALGWLDLLSPFIFLPFKWLISKFGYKAIPLHVCAVGIWVGYLLQLNFGTPMIVTIPLLLIGESIAEVVIGIPIAEIIKRRLKL